MQSRQRPWGRNVHGGQCSWSRKAKGEWEPMTSEGRGPRQDLASTLSEREVVEGFEEVTRSDLCSESIALTAVGTWAKQATGRNLCSVQAGDGGWGQRHGEGGW